MKKGRKIFIITEAVLAVMVFLVAFAMLWERRGRNLDKISVIVENSDDTQWSAFKYGLRMAAEDNGVEMFFRKYRGRADSGGTAADDPD